VAVVIVRVIILLATCARILWRIRRMCLRVELSSVQLGWTDVAETSVSWTTSATVLATGSLLGGISTLYLGIGASEDGVLSVVHQIVLTESNRLNLLPIELLNMLLGCFVQRVCRYTLSFFFDH